MFVECPLLTDVSLVELDDHFGQGSVNEVTANGLTIVLDGGTAQCHDGMKVRKFRDGETETGKVHRVVYGRTDDTHTVVDRVLIVPDLAEAGTIHGPGESGTLVTTLPSLLQNDGNSACATSVAMLTGIRRIPLKTSPGQPLRYSVAEPMDRVMQRLRKESGLSQLFIGDSTAQSRSKICLFVILFSSRKNTLKHLFIV